VGYDFTEIIRDHDVPYTDLLVQLATSTVAAIRSGDYTQGKGRLNRQVGDTRFHCCLGVLCDVVANSGEGEWRQVEDDGSTGIHRFEFFYRGGTDIRSHDWSIIPTNLAAEMQVSIDMSVIAISDAGIEFLGGFGLPIYNPYKRHVGLAWLNDNGFTFGQIATIIERALNRDGIVFVHELDPQHPETY
jgi:hypothetical protein